MARAHVSREGELGGPSAPLGISSMCSAHHATDTSLPMMEELPLAARLGCPASAKGIPARTIPPSGSAPLAAWHPKFMEPVTDELKEPVTQSGLATSTHIGSDSSFFTCLPATMPALLHITPHSQP